MNFFRKFFKDKKVPAIVDPLIGKTVIHFTTHGCMGQINEFDYIGTIIGSTIKEDRYKMYQVQVLKDKSGEARDNNVSAALRTVPSWYLQDLGGDFLIAYD